jgi:hypothetical protein
MLLCNARPEAIADNLVVLKQKPQQDNVDEEDVLFSSLEEYLLPKMKN